MEQLFCSDSFNKFFNSLDYSVSSANELNLLIEKNFEPLARDANIGKLILSLKAPATIYDPKGIDVQRTVYGMHNECGDHSIKNGFITGENGRVELEAYPVKGHEWTETEKNSVNFLAKFICLVCGRARLMGLMHKTALTDSLTGTSNITVFMQYGGELTARRKLSEYAGIYLNIKNFKYINKRVGARQGDEILKRYCSVLNGFIGADGKLARLGGDNFMVLIVKERLDEFVDFAMRITLELGPVTFSVESRMGIYPINVGDTMSEVMNCSSVAYNLTRTAGNCDCIRFDKSMLEKVLREKEISVMFASALENREFVIYYQPKVELETNRLCGCEALVRWIRNGKIIPPMEFIPVLEQEGSICKLDFYVLDAVCRDVREWLDNGIDPVCISTNFSKQHLHNRRLADDIISVLQKYDIDSKYIETELTEMSGYEDYDALTDFVSRMKEYGINTSIDDFGTGYSSLNLVKDLNVDIIKLDKSFLNNIEQNNKTDEIVIKNIVNMVNELDMSVIAEGVETHGQADFLRRINCSMAQGFLFDKPLTHDDFEKRLSGRRIYDFCEA